MKTDYIKLEVRCPHCGEINILETQDFIFDNVQLDYDSIEFDCEYCFNEVVIEVK